MIPKLNKREDLHALLPRTDRELERRVDDVIATVDRIIKGITIRAADWRTFDDTVRACDRAISSLQSILGICELLHLVHPDEGMREMAQKSLVRLQGFYIDEVMGNRDLYRALKEYVQTRADNEELSAEQRRYLDELLRDLERGGLGLPDEQLNEVKRLGKELAVLTTTFDANINNDTSCITATRDELAGLDDAFIASLGQDDHGNFIIPANTPSYVRIRSHCQVEKTREAMMLTFDSRAYPANEGLLQEICTKRHELAKILGFPSFAHLNLDDQMAKSPERVEAFLEDLRKRSQSPMEAEFELFRKHLPAGVTLDEKGRFKPWDVGYVSETYKKEKLAVDDQKVAEYFPLQKTIDELLVLYERFLSVEFRHEPLEDAWHEDVRYVAVHRRGKLIGHLLFDLYPRPHKYGHACEIGLVPAALVDGELYPPAIAVIANFPRPVDSRPALLNLDEVSTFFHEFGHAMHALFGATDMIGFSGTSVKQDFVEVPSQMFEEWLSEPSILKRISSHYQTSEPLDDATIERICNLKRFGAAYFVQRQVGLSRFALALYRDGGAKNFGELRRLYLHQSRSRDILNDERSHFECSFGHLTGYAARYYSYLWSKVYSLDLFYAIRETGLVNSEVGERLITTLLGRGGSDDPDTLVQNFLGRPMSMDAFIRDLGLE